MIRVALSAGHYWRFGDDPKKTCGSFNEIYEHDVCTDIVKWCFESLKDRNIEVVVIEPNPVIYKVDEIQNGDFDIAIEVHLNFNKDSKYTGIETACNESARQLATIIQGQLVIDLKDMDRGVYLDDKDSILRHLSIPTIIPKIGFLSNNIFMEKCKRNEIQEVAGKSIADSILFYTKNFGIGECT